MKHFMADRIPRGCFEVLGLKYFIIYLDDHSTVLVAFEVDFGVCEVGGVIVGHVL